LNATVLPIVPSGRLATSLPQKDTCRMPTTQLFTLSTGTLIVICSWRA